MRQNDCGIHQEFFRSRILRKKSADKTIKEGKNEVHELKAMFESEISEAKSAIEEVCSDVTEVKASIEEVSSDITEVKASIEELRSEMNENMNVIKSLLSAQAKPPV